MKKGFKVTKTSFEKVALHNALIAEGFTFMEGSQTYLFEYLDEGQECHIVLDSLQTMSFELTVAHLGAQTFNRYLNRNQRLTHYHLSQALMKASTEFFDNQMPKAANQG